MTLIEILAAAAAGPVAADVPRHLNPLKLFLDADIVVKLVMAGLILASVWVWTIIVSFSLRHSALKKRCDDYERGFWKAENIDAFQTEMGKGDVPSAKVAAAGLAEWRRSVGTKGFDKQGARERLGQAMDSAIALEAEKLSERLNFLATVGAVAPFVGLFGTVWGIMGTLGVYSADSFTMAQIAPKLSEALFATAIGLFAAIPAVIAYNRFSHRVDQLEARLQRFADKLHASLSRELEGM